MATLAAMSGCAATPNDPGAASSAHVVLVALPAQGHMNPFNSLAHYLAASGISVTLVRAARANVLLSQAQDSSSSSLSSSLSPLPTNHAAMSPIRIEVVPDGMPTDPKHRLDVSKIRQLVDIIGKGVEELLEKMMQEEKPPCCLVLDHLFGWGRDVADKFGLPWMILWAGSASIFSVGFHLPELVARGYLPAIGEGAKDKIVDFIPGLSPFRIRDLPKPIKLDEDPEKDPFYQFFRTLFSNAKHTDRILVDSIYELESSVVEALRKEAGFRIVPIGPLFLMSSLSSAVNVPRANLLLEDNSCLSWLDQQQQSSVLYISFGSVVSVEADVLRELAHGLEASGLNFLWVIRPDVLSDKASVQELLPESFMERTHDQGRIISWAPQLAVLDHPSVGAFLTHCGWNSVLESLSHGVPMLGFPQQADQTSNLKLIVNDWKVGLPLLQPGMQQVERIQVQHAMIAIMRGDEGMEVRKHALQLKEIALKACNGSSKSNLEKLAHDLISRHLNVFEVPKS